MARYINIYAQHPMQTLTGQQGGNLGYVSNPVSMGQNLGSDVDKENPENQMKAMDARNEQNAKKIMSLNEQEKGKQMPAYAGGTKYHPGGNAIVGEEGEEVVKTPDGNETVVSQPTVVNLPQGSSVIPMNLGEKDIKTIDGRTIGTQQNPTSVSPVTGQPMTAKDLVEKMKEERAQIDADYQKQLNRARMFEALHRGLSALTQYGAKTSGNAALPYDDTVWKAVQTELGQRWKQNREDLVYHQKYDTEQMKLQNTFLNAQNKNNIAQQNADTNRMNAETRQRAQELNDRYIQSRIDANKALEEYRNNQTNASKEIAKAKLAVYEAQIQNYISMMSDRGLDAEETERHNKELEDIARLKAELDGADVVTTEDNGFTTTTKRVHKDVKGGGTTSKKSNPYQTNTKKKKPY